MTLWNQKLLTFFGYANFVNPKRSFYVHQGRKDGDLAGFLPPRIRQKSTAVQAVRFTAMMRSTAPMSAMWTWMRMSISALYLTVTTPVLTTATGTITG